MISSTAIRAILSAMLTLATVATPGVAATPTTTKMEIFPRDPSFGDPVIVEFEAATDTGQLPDALLFSYLNDIDTWHHNGRPSLRHRNHVSVGARSSCTVTSSGAAACWGDGVHGQLGRGSTTSAALPLPMTGFSNNVRAVASAEDFNCLLTEAGSVWCTGRNDRGQLGDDSLVDRSTPVQVFGLNAGVRLLASGGALSCAVKGDSQYTCWGDGDTRPSSLATLPAPIKSITVGYRICVLTVDLEVYCANPARDSQGNRGVMTKVAGLPSGIMSVAAGKSHVCALHQGAAPNSGLWCWGSNAQGQFGNGTTSPTSSDALVQVQLPLFSTSDGRMMLVTAGDGHTCITRLSPWCAGNMGTAPSGYENGSTFRPFLMSSIIPLVGVASGGLSTCVINLNGQLTCIGDTANNKLGSLADTIARRDLAASLVFNGVYQVPVGTQTFKAKLTNFKGSSQYIESSVSKDIKVFAKTTVTLTATQNPIVYAEPIVLTAQVIGNDGSIPSGQVAFYRDNVIAATIALDETGKAVFNEGVRNPGTRPYSAHYLGAEPWRTSSGRLDLIVNRIPATLSLELLTASPVMGQPVKVKITGTTTGQPPSGQIHYSVRGVPGIQIGTMTNGAMEISFTPSVHGAHDIQISFAPTAVYEAQTARLTVIVKDKPTVTVKANTPTVRTGDLMSYTITVRGSDGAPSGGAYHLFESGKGVDSGTLDANGTATASYRSNQTGNLQLTARFYGSSTQEPATSAPTPIVVNKGDVTISTPNIPPLQRFGTPLSFEVTWKENSWWTYGGEQVTLELNGKPHSTVDVNYLTGKAKFNLPNGLPFGTHQIAVTYTPAHDDGLNAARSATVTASADFKLGSQLRVNTGVAGHQSSPAIATSRTGGGMVVWISKPTAAMPGGVTARLIGTDGLPTGSDIAVNTPSQSVGSDQYPAVAALTGGGYVVAWQSAQRIFFRLYTSTGTPIGKKNAIPASSSTPRWQRPAVVATPDGGFAIGWYSAGANTGQQFIYITRFNKSGTPVRPRLQLAFITGQILAVDAPALAVLNGTGDVVAGFATGSSTKGYLRLQRASPTALIGTAVSLPSDAGQALQPLTVGLIGASKVAAVWTSPAGSNSLKWMSYSSTLTAPSAVQTLAKNVVLSSGPSVTTINVGELAVAWTGYDTNGMGTFVQLLDATGKPSGGIGTINTTLDANQTDPALATLFTAGKPSKTWVAVWTDTSAAFQGDIYLQRFAAP